MYHILYRGLLAVSQHTIKKIAEILTQIAHALRSDQLYKEESKALLTSVSSYFTNTNTLPHSSQLPAQKLGLAPTPRILKTCLTSVLTAPSLHPTVVPVVKMSLTAISTPLADDNPSSQDCVRTSTSILTNNLILKFQYNVKF